MLGTYCWSCDEHRQDGDRVTRRRRLVRLNGRMRCSCRWCVAKRGTHTYHGDERAIQRNTPAPKRSRRSYRWWRRLASTSHHMLCRPQLWVHSWHHMSWHYPAPPPSRPHKGPAARCPRGRPRRWRLTLAAGVSGEPERCKTAQRRRSGCKLGPVVWNLFFGDGKPSGVGTDTQYGVVPRTVECGVRNTLWNRVIQYLGRYD